MNIETYWLNATTDQRMWVLIDCNYPRPLAPRAAKWSWETLPPTLQDILTRKAREGVLGL